MRGYESPSVITIKLSAAYINNREEDKCAKYILRDERKRREARDEDRCDQSNVLTCSQFNNIFDGLLSMVST